MAMVKCPECSEEISSDARTCPHCGKQVPRRSVPGLSLRNMLLAIAGLLVLLVVIGQHGGRDPSGSHVYVAPTYGDFANDEAKACQQKYPDAPESYCKRQGLAKALAQLCKDKPWECER